MPCESLRRLLAAGAIPAVVAFALLGCLPASAVAQTPAGNVEISQVQIAFVVSGNLGSGRLQFRGRTYAFSIGGLGVGGLGINKLEAAGAVYGLDRIEEFPGVYGALRTGVAVGETGRGQLWLENTNGVRIHLRARREGIGLSMGGDGIVIQMK